MFMTLFGLIMIYCACVLCRERRQYTLGQACKQGTFTMYLAYRFAYWYTWTPGSTGIVLTGLCIALLAFGGALLSVCTGDPLASALWTSWSWVANPDGGSSADTFWGRAVGALVSLGGMLIFALLVAFMTSSIETVLSRMRDGKYPIIENGHTVVLGWSPVLLPLLDELCQAAASQGGSYVAILTALEKSVVEALIRETSFDLHGTKLVVRTGDVCSSEDIAKVAVASASLVVVLADTGLPYEQADAKTLNVLLTLHARRWPTYGSILVQCKTMRNQKLFRRLCWGKGKVLGTDSFVGKLMVQASRQRGLRQVISSTFGFASQEFYIHNVAGVEGLTFRDVMLALPNAVAVGVVAETGVINMLPHFDYVCAKNQELVLLADDVSLLPDAVCVESAAHIYGRNILSAIAKRCPQSGARIPALEPEGQITVVIGWNDIVLSLLPEIDRVVGAGSQMFIYAPQTEEERLELLEASHLVAQMNLKNIAVTHVQGPLGARAKLEALPIVKAANIFILADGSATSAEVADRTTVALILHVQDILDEHREQFQCADAHSPVIVPQILEQTTAEACQHIDLGDFVDSNRLAAQILATISRFPRITTVLSDVLSETGTCHFCIRELSEYPAAANNFLLGQSDCTICFNEVLAIASLSGEIAIGWSSENNSASDRWEFNPWDRLQKRSWSAHARIIALARTHRSMQDKQILDGCSPPCKRARYNVSPSRDGAESVGIYNHST